MTTQPFISFIGSGNMAYALLKGLIQANYPSPLLCASHPNQARLQFLQQELAINITTDNKIASQKANVIVLCVKPQQMASVLKEIAASIQPSTLIISIAAGITITTIQQHLSQTFAIIRAMPNLPVMVSQGATGLFADLSVSESQRETADYIFRQTGITCWLNQEHLLAVVAALSGSGPAYCFYMMEALIKKAVALGLNNEQARLLSAQTFLGAAQLVLTTEEDLLTWCERVTSKKGMTEQALQSLTNANVALELQKALQAAYDRAQMLAIEYSLT